MKSFNDFYLERTKEIKEEGEMVKKKLGRRENNGMKFGRKDILIAVPFPSYRTGA